MTPYEVALRYSKALLNLFSGPAELEASAQELRVILAALKRLPDWKNFFSIPQVPVTDKQQAIKTALEGKISGKLLNFILFTIEKGRFIYFPLIVREFERRVSKVTGIKLAKLITPYPLSKENKNLLKEKLESSFSKKFAIKEKIDPSLQGGIILMMDNRMIDFSIKNRIKQLKEHLTAIG